jgi:hypothetical protein
MQVNSLTMAFAYVWGGLDLPSAVALGPETPIYSGALQWQLFFPTVIDAVQRIQRYKQKQEAQLQQVRSLAAWHGAEKAS